MAELFANATLEDIAKDPRKYGAPTYEEYVRNRSRYQAQTANLFDVADNGTSNLKMVLKGYRYEIDGYKCDTLEEVERVAKSQGYSEEDLEMLPEVIPLGGGWCDILVRFRHKPKGFGNEKAHD
jgi:hypothetical protein